MTPPLILGKPRLLDLFCGAGGCSVGYERAGFEVEGIDLAPQPNYPFEFCQADALDVLRSWDIQLREWDAIHASPPCQAYTGMNRRWENTNPALIAEIRDLLEATGLPYVIENVSGAAKELRDPIQICGRSMAGLLHRHRLFETNFPVLSHPCTGGRDPFGVYGKLDGRRLWTRADGSTYNAPANLEEAQHAMGIDWMTWDELREAIPPAYTEHIGSYLLTEIQARQKAAA